MPGVAESGWTESTSRDRDRRGWHRQRRVASRAVTRLRRTNAMTGTQQVLFIQGGGAGAHDEWDDKLVDSLSRRLGDEHEVRYPRMPDEGDPSYARWGPAIRREMADLADGAIVAGHSVGGTILVHALAEQPPDRRIAAIVLIAAPFVGAGRLARRRVRAAGRPRREAAAGRAGARVPRTRGRDRPAVACRPLCPRDPAGAGAPAARARSPAEQRSERSGQDDQKPYLIPGAWGTGEPGGHAARPRFEPA